MNREQRRILMVLSALMLSVLSLTVGLTFSQGKAQAAGPVCTVDDDGGGVDYTSIDAAVDDSGCMTVTVAAGMYVEGVTINDRTLAIVGAGKGSTVINAGGSVRPLYLSNSTVTVSGVTLFNGNVPTASGGGVYNNGATLSLIDSEIISSTAEMGGGIYNAGALTLTNVMLKNNATLERGGGLYNSSTARATLIDTAILSGTAALDGGGISNHGTLTMDGSTVAYNTMSGTGSAGGIRNSGSMTITNSTIAQNTVLTGAGGGIHHSGGSKLVIVDSEIISNTSEYKGAGLWTWGDAELTRVTIGGNESILGDGGGIGMDSSSTMTLIDSTIISNTASSYGGGISTYSANPGARTAIISRTVVSHNSAGNRGGGIYNTSVVTLTNSAIVSNTAGRGGGIENIGGGSLSLTNVTLSGNIAQDDGGGLFHYSGTTDLVNVTVVNNRTVGGDGGGVRRFQDSLNVKNTLIAGNTDDGDEAPDCDGTLSSLGYNVIGDTTGCTLGGSSTGVISNTGTTVVDPLTEDRGTFVHPIGIDSVAKDAGTDVGCPGTDQRGALRVGACDIGAYEYVRWVYLPLTLKDSY
jgi:predicted outer membrane repeat protein